MRQFAEAIIDTAALRSRKSRNRFLRACDIWTTRLYKRGLISLSDRQLLRNHIADACLATFM